MIRYALSCAGNHGFEAWFRSSEDFDEQLEAGVVICPHCGSGDVSKALMTPGLTGAAAKFPTFAPGADPVSKELIRSMRRLRDHVRENADYVGEKFAEEARRIHYEEAEPRGIYGEATREEARELGEEGIDVHPLPVLPDDQN